jgi:hypothetical protein
MTNSDTFSATRWLDDERLLQELGSTGGTPPHQQSSSSFDEVGRQADFPDADLYPSGLVGEIADWICRWTAEPIRLHAVGAALATVGTLVGRKVWTESRPAGTALYFAALARTGMGKDHPMRCMRLLLDAVAGDNSRHIPWNASLPSLAARLLENASQVMIVDEFSDTLSALRSRNASTTTAALSGGLRTLWGKNQGSWTADQALMRASPSIKWPNLSFYGAATVANWKDAMVVKDITNGLFNRFLILPRYADVPITADPKGIIEIPQPLLDQLTWLDQCLPSSQAGLAQRGDRQPTQPILVPFSEEAHRLNEENKQVQSALLKAGFEGDDTRELYGRYAEQIKRMALIVACGRRPEAVARAVIEGSDMMFAQKLVRWSIDQMVGMARREMVENQFQAQHKMVLGIIRNERGREITKGEITRRIAGRIPRKPYEEILGMLVESGSVGTRELTTGRKGGRPSSAFWFVRD